MEKIILINEKKELFENIKPLISTKFILLNFASPSIDRTKDNIKAILMACDFSCNFHECLMNFQSVYRFKNFPLFIIRPFLFITGRPTKRLFHLSAMVPSSNQRNRTIQALLRKLIEYDLDFSLDIHPSMATHKILRIQKHLSQNVFCDDSLHSLASIVDTSATTLSSNFKRISGLSIKAYSSKIKLCYSLWKLLSSGELIKSIAIDLGYKPLSFSQKFRTWAGISPQDLRKNLCFLQNNDGKIM